MPPATAPTSSLPAPGLGIRCERSNLSTSEASGARWGNCGSRMLGPNETVENAVAGGLKESDANRQRTRDGRSQ